MKNSIPTIKAGIYEHYKGQKYRVLTVAHHSETEEPLVVYEALYPTEYGETSFWVRPYKMFVEQVNVEGKMIDRFAFCCEQ